MQASTGGESREWSTREAMERSGSVLMPLPVKARDAGGRLTVRTGPPKDQDLPHSTAAGLGAARSPVPTAASDDGADASAGVNSNVYDRLVEALCMLATDPSPSVAKCGRQTLQSTGTPATVSRVGGARPAGRILLGIQRIDTHVYYV